jgi:iron complex transport system substrate-binding protein
MLKLIIPSKLFSDLKLILILISLTIIAGCGNKEKKSESSDNSVNQVERAERFSIEKKDGYTEIKIINPWQGATNINQIYYLVQRGAEIPKGLDRESVIFVPLRSIVCMSTTHIAMISALGEENSITGVSGKDFIYSRTVIKNIEKGLVADVGYEANLNKELILKLSPELIMIYARSKS